MDDTVSNAIFLAIYNQEWDVIYHYLNNYELYAKEIHRMFSLDHLPRNTWWLGVHTCGLHRVVAQDAPLELVEKIWDLVPYGDINPKTQNTPSVLFYCRSVEVFDFFISKGADVNLVDKYDETIMFEFYRTITVNEVLLRKLMITCLKHGCDYSKKSRSSGCTILQKIHYFESLDPVDLADVISVIDPEGLPALSVYDFLVGRLALLVIMQCLERVGANAPIKVLPKELIRRLKDFL